MWLATAKGLRVLDAKEASAPRLDAGTSVVDDDTLDLALDRFGRIWALGSAAIAIVDTGVSPTKGVSPEAKTTVSSEAKTTASPDANTGVSPKAKTTAGGTR
jgi:hypothetical protein